MYARIFHKRVRQSQEWGRGLGQPYRTHARGLRSTLSWGRGGARRTRWVHIHNMSHHHARVDCTSHFQASRWNGTVMWGEVELKLTLGQKKSKGFKSTPPYGVSTGLDAPIIIGTCTELGRFPLYRSRPPTPLTTAYAASGWVGNVANQWQQDHLRTMASPLNRQEMCRSVAA